MRVERMRTGISFSLTDGDRDRLIALVAARNTPQNHVWRSYAEKLAKANGVALPAGYATDFRACHRFLDQHA
jgi:hypothetical protein